MAERTGLGARIEALRSIAGLSPSELHALSGLKNRSHVRKIETGKIAGNVGGLTLQKIARVFGVDTDWLISGEGRRPSDAAILAAVNRARAVQVRQAS